MVAQGGLFFGLRETGVPSSMFYSRAQASYAFPMLSAERLWGAIVYYDGQFNDTRYGLSVMLTAIQAGATAANHVKVVGLTHSAAVQRRRSSLGPAAADALPAPPP